MVSFFISCAPTFDIEKERTQIQKFVFDEFDIEKRIELFYPDQNKSDSLIKIYRENKLLVDGLTDELKTLSNQGIITINNVTSTITIQNRLFRLVNITQSFRIPKQKIEIAYEDFENYLKSNLYSYTEDSTTYSITGKTNIIAIHHNNSWEYFDFNASFLYDAYGMKDAQKLVQLYDKELFEPAAEKWDEESVQIYKEQYQEIKHQPQYKDLDFDAYCNCLIKHIEKVDDDTLLETDYYESETYLNLIYMCRILTTRE